MFVNTIAPTVPTSRKLGPTLLIGGAIVLAVGGASAGWLLRGNAGVPPPTVVASTYEPLDATPAATSPRTAEAPQPAAPAPRAAAQKPAPVARTAPKSTPRTADHPTHAERSTPLDTRPAAVCSTCGIVESVMPVTRKGDGSGVGAVAGGVVGAVVGNQIGGGNGRKAMTVLGAIGGGLAGHEIEKRAKAETVYEVKVRMEDGSTRTITQATQPAAGTTRAATSAEPSPSGAASSCAGLTAGTSTCRSMRSSSGPDSRAW